MRCSPYAWIFIFTSILRLSAVASAYAGSADNTSTESCSSVCLDALSAQASKLSQECSSAADSKRTSLLAEGQSEIAADVRSTQERLMKCGLNSDSLLYFRCLQDTMDEVRERLEEIVKKSTKLIAHHAVELSEIDKEETDCLAEVVWKSKLESDQAFAEYKECLSTGSDCCCSSLTTSPSSTASPSPTSFTWLPSSIPPTSSSSTSSSSASASLTWSPSSIPSTSSPSSPPSESSTSSLPSPPSTLAPSSPSSTSTAQPTKEESSMVAPEAEMGVQPHSTDGSATFVTVTIASVVLVIILLIGTYFYRKKATRSRFQLKTLSSLPHDG